MSQLFLSETVALGTVDLHRSVDFHPFSQQLPSYLPSQWAHLLGQGHLCQLACQLLRNSVGNIFGGQRMGSLSAFKVSCTEPGKAPISSLDTSGKSCRVSCLYSTTPLTLFKLIVINFDKFHLLTCLATQHEGYLFLDNNKLHHVVLGCLGVL